MNFGMFVFSIPDPTSSLFSFSSMQISDNTKGISKSLKQLDNKVIKCESTADKRLPGKKLLNGPTLG